MSREDLDACSVGLGCPSEVHLSDCPWHPDNVQHIVLPAEEYDRLMEELERPAQVNEKLMKLMKETPRVIRND